MTDLEREQRKMVVDEAKSWLNTPYAHMGRVKGGGVDCGMFLLEVFERCGLIEHTNIPYYPNDWMLHRSEEKYLGWVKKFGKKVVDREPLAGDVILYKFGRCISHAAIVIDYPLLIHSWAMNNLGVMYIDAQEMANRQAAIYSFWG
jgi:cell wall-associated NlpC family hydrolase